MSSFQTLSHGLYQACLRAGACTIDALTGPQNARGSPAAQTQDYYYRSKLSYLHRFQSVSCLAKLRAFSNSNKPHSVGRPELLHADRSIHQIHQRFATCIKTPRASGQRYGKDDTTRVCGRMRSTVGNCGRHICPFGADTAGTRGRQSLIRKICDSLACNRKWNVTPLIRHNRQRSKAPCKLVCCPILASTWFATCRHDTYALKHKRRWTQGKRLSVMPGRNISRYALSAALPHCRDHTLGREVHKEGGDR